MVMAARGHRFACPISEGRCFVAGAFGGSTTEMTSIPIQSSQLAEPKPSMQWPTRAPTAERRVCRSARSAGPFHSHHARGRAVEDLILLWPQDTELELV